MVSVARLLTWCILMDGGGEAAICPAEEDYSKASEAHLYEYF